MLSNELKPYLSHRETAEYEIFMDEVRRLDDRYKEVREQIEKIGSLASSRRYAETTKPFIGKYFEWLADEYKELIYVYQSGGRVYYRSISIRKHKLIFEDGEVSPVYLQYHGSKFKEIGKDKFMRLYEKYLNKIMKVYDEM